MRIGVTVIVLLVGLALSWAVWAMSGGRVAFVFLPLLLGLPLVWKRRR